MGDAQAAEATGLDPVELEAWKRDGFMIFDEFVDQATLASLRQAYDEVLSGEVSVPDDGFLGDITRSVMNPHSAHPRFDDNRAVEQALELARSLFGSADVHRSYDMLIYKPPGHPHPTPWHQDYAYTQLPFAPAGAEIGDNMAQFWIPLDDVDRENGCMQFVPGQHTQPLLEHRVVSGDPAHEDRLLALVDPDEQLDLASAFVAQIPAGGATVHAYGTPHYTGPNLSADRPRRAYIFTITSGAREA
jgi:ectoine hydroxylase-related dioxygenase (phytanoyl-CoA dioxygenase family)